ncbi:transposase [Paraburkholderia pallida]|uniref:Transposase n=1 Tax=Paraburkholderia pallida TaxID=2547399 RepID=A0A4P7D4W8_9BURK|nr:transposase [Paraburkholderia pallida]
MEAAVIDVDLWTLIEPLPPMTKPGDRDLGQPRVSNRAVLNGILFAIEAGIR